MESLVTVLPDMNAFRILGDGKSAEGVSLITQVLYLLVFCARYLDLFWISPARSYWNFVLKNFFILSSLYIVFLMMSIYARTREREKAWKFGAACLAGSVVLAPFVMMLFEGQNAWSFLETLWSFSIILESVCVLPQLLLLRQTIVPTVIDSFYLVTLGSYRAFYILNWIVRFAKNGHFDATAVVFGVIQTAFYVDFAWVYWTRQRVKLRNGGVVDSEDLSRGWLVSKVLGRGNSTIDEEDSIAVPESGDNHPGRQGHVGSRGKWGVRGISVSADEGVLDAKPLSKTRALPTEIDSDTRAEEVIGILEDNDEFDESEDEFRSRNIEPNKSLTDVGNGQEWRQEDRK